MCISFDRDSYCSWIVRTIFIYSHSNTVLGPPHKSPNIVIYIYESKTCGLKIRVYMWTRMDVMLVANGTLTQMFHLKMWLFKFITGITFRWWCYDILFLFWYVLVFGNKTSIYRVTSDQFKWYFQGFSFM